ncbi:hypothetical protein KJP29_08595 [Maritimibacter sp. DP1N21-5]|uniref:hypothetical protein n=1 Tax=Tateyamaria omphalii TaxID=299262 RepID=UPI001C46268E|nr:hypothetical protein [Tateyamaria omphalii]MBV7409038.1 hypothetical protein [Maritimibacter sp. DP1N21-5]MBY5934275.1 hypothetical protein [Tateyamaria omphalii]
MIKTYSSPSEISETLLERTGDALLSHDFDSFADCFFIPYGIETVNGKRTIGSRENLNLTFDAVHAHLLKQQVTIMARHCVSASFRSPNEVAATHETRLISRDILVQDPYPAFSLIKRQPNGVWKVAFTSYVIVDSADLNNALHA